MQRSKTFLNLAFVMLTASLSTPAFAFCVVEFPNDGFICREEEGGIQKESIGFGDFIGSQPDLNLRLGVVSIQGLFGGCITPLDINGNAISECTVCDSDLTDVEPNTIECETNVFPVDIRLITS